MRQRNAATGHTGGGGTRLQLDGHRPKGVQAVVGWITVHRAAYHCPAGGPRTIPRDPTLKLTRDSHSPGVRRLTSRFGGLRAFAQAAATLEEAAGIRRSARTVRTVTEAVERDSYSLNVPPSGRRLGDDLGYLELPHFASLGQEVTYVEAARQTIATIDLPATCGWVIDLRLNTGGGYAPMVTAAGPILGDGRFAGLRWSNGRQTWLGYLRHR